MAQPFSEAFADAGPRPHYVALLRRLDEIGPEELEERARRIDSMTLRTATRSGPSSTSVELTKMRSRWSGVRITMRPLGQWLAR